MRRIVIMIISLASIATVVKGQAITYIHDAAKMNQVTVMELGTGVLTPSFYYWLFCPVYKNSAAATNKMLYRTSAGLSSYQQVEMADSIDSCQVARAKIEALNIADRSGGILDLAWVSEGDKINDMMKRFEKNIGMLSHVPNAAGMKPLWEEHYDKFLCAIKSTQDAYMPNSQRQDQYIKIYQDIVKENETLVKVIETMEYISRLDEFLEEKPLVEIDQLAIIKEAFQRWKDNTEIQSNSNQ